MGRKQRKKFKKPGNKAEPRGSPSPSPFGGDSPARPGSARPGFSLREISGAGGDSRPRKAQRIEMFLRHRCSHFTANPPEFGARKAGNGYSFCLRVTLLCQGAGRGEHPFPRVLFGLGASPAPGPVTRGAPQGRKGWLSSASLDLHLDLHLNLQFGLPLRVNLFAEGWPGVPLAGSQLCSGSAPLSLGTQVLGSESQPVKKHPSGKVF